LRFLLENLEGAHCGADVRRRHRRRVDASVRCVAQQQGDRRINGGEAADCRERLAQGPDSDIDRCGVEPEVLGCTPPGWPDNSEGMCFVRKQVGPVPAHELHEPWEGRKMSLHGVRRFDHDETPTDRCSAAQDQVKVIEVVVREALDRSSRQQRPVVKRPMDVSVEDDQITWTEERGDD
jgi:hypothetical protein